MGMYTNGQNAAVAGLTAVITHISVHSAIPNSSGSNELSGGSYARQAVTWTSPASGAASNNAQITHPIPAGSTAAYYGYWSALTSGTFYGFAPRTGTGETNAGFGSVDSSGVTSNTIQSAANGLSNSQNVILSAVLAESLPTGLSASTLYFVVGAATNTFQLSLTDGGAAVDITAQGELYWQRVVPEPFASAGSLVAATNQIILSGVVIS